MLDILQVDDITIENISKLQGHFKRNEISQAVTLAQKELKAFERDWFTEYYLKHFGNLIKQMSSWVVKSLNYTEGQMLGFMDILDKLSTTMANHNITNIFDYIPLMKKDPFQIQVKSIFGTKKFTGFFKSKLKKNQEQSRQCLHVMTRLKIAVIRLPHVINDEERSKLIKDLNKDLKAIAKRFGSNTNFDKLIKSNGIFKCSNAELKHTVDKNLLIPINHSK